jgi:hypothetical protein
MPRTFTLTSGNIKPGRQVGTHAKVFSAVTKVARIRAPRERAAVTSVTQEEAEEYQR